MNEKEKVTRRKFLEDSSKKALAGTAAAFLGLGMIKPKTVEAAGCTGSCSGSCTSSCSDVCAYDCTNDCVSACTAECINSCSYGCDTCTGSCEGSCQDSCSGFCSDACAFDCTNDCVSACTSKFSYQASDNAQGQCGTPVSDREVSNRHVTV